MANFFTADLHFSHARIIELCKRPFDSVDEMNRAIIARWNARVHREDTVYVMGDVAMGRIDESLSLVTQLNGHKLLVPGNHDRCWSGNRVVRPIDVIRYTSVGFTILPENTMLDMSGSRWRLCHFPYEGDSHDNDRHVKHRPTRTFRDETLIHGHVHGAWQMNGDQVNVGVDVWDFRPVHEREIRELIGQ